MRIFYLRTNNTYNVHGDYGASGDPLKSTGATMSVGDSFHLFMKMSLNTVMTNAEGTLGAKGAFFVASGTLAVPNPITFDSTTRFFFCTDIDKTPHAYCEIVGFATWYVFETANKAFNYFFGLYRTLVLLIFCNTFKSNPSGFL